MFRAVEVIRGSFGIKLLSGCDKKDEKEVLFLGGMCKLERSEGDTVFL